VNAGGVDAEALGSGQSFSGEFEEYAFEDEFRHAAVFNITASCTLGLKPCCAAAGPG
jgi:hypothetical protein